MYSLLDKGIHCHVSGCTSSTFKKLPMATGWQHILDLKAFVVMMYALGNIALDHSQDVQCHYPTPSPSSQQVTINTEKTALRKTHPYLFFKDYKGTIWLGFPVDTWPAWPGRDPIPADRGIKIPTFGFLGADYTRSLTNKTDSGEPFQAFIPVCTALLSYLFQPQQTCWFYFYLIPVLLMLAFFMQMWADHLPTNHQRSIKTDQLHLGSLQLNLETDRREHSWHRRWVSCMWDLVRFCLPRGQERRGQSNTDTKICIVQRGILAFFSFDEAVGDHHSVNSTDNNAGQMWWKLCQPGTR